MGQILGIFDEHSSLGEMLIILLLGISHSSFIWSMMIFSDGC